MNNKYERIRSMIPSKEVKEKIDARYKRLPYASINKFLKENPDVDLFLTKLVESDKWFENKRRAFSLIAKSIYEPVRCKVCGKEIEARKCIGSVRQYCSNKCSCSSNDRLEKVKKTSLKRYGVENVFQNKEIQEKQKQTCLNKYGVENVFQDDNVKEKIKKTCLDKYGSEYFVKTDLYLEKTKSTNIQRYGTQFVSQNKDIQEKIKKTNIRKYGVQHPAQCKEVVGKMKQTCLNRYGVDCTLKVPEIDKKRQDTWNDRYGGNPFQFEQVIEKRINTNIQKYGSTNYVNSRIYFNEQFHNIKNRFAGKIEPLFTQDEYEGINSKKVYKWKCCKCGNQFQQKLYTTDIDENERYLPRCLKCYPYMTGKSKEQKEVVDFIKSFYNGEIIENDRNLIFPYELDVLIPEYKLAVQFDGLYWHIDKDKYYHFNKTEECWKKGYRLIHIFENQWLYKQEIVKSIIKSNLNTYEYKVDAETCNLKEVNKHDTDDFLQNNHIFGKTQFDMSYGLYYNSKLVSIITCFNGVLTRFGNKLGYYVVGGLSRLVNALKCNYNENIKVYIDRRYFNGDEFKEIEFRLIEKTDPELFYIDKSCKSMSIYDCGKMVYASVKQFKYIFIK